MKFLAFLLKTSPVFSGFFSEFLGFVSSFFGIFPEILCEYCVDALCGPVWGYWDLFIIFWDTGSSFFWRRKTFECVLNN